MQSFNGEVWRYAKERFNIDSQQCCPLANISENQLKALERMRAKIEELKQPTIAEIKSYSDPPASVGDVMKATFLLLGESYNDLQVNIWYNINDISLPI